MTSEARNTGPSGRDDGTNTAFPLEGHPLVREGDTFLQNSRGIALSTLPLAPYFFEEAHFAFKSHVNISSYSLNVKVHSYTK